MDWFGSVQFDWIVWIVECLPNRIWAIRFERCQKQNVRNREGKGEECTQNVHSFLSISICARKSPKKNQNTTPLAAIQNKKMFLPPFGKRINVPTVRFELTQQC